jgi:8-oxo-dGTP pyrophosphatase MutT (NUDIX family)
MDAPHFIVATVIIVKEGKYLALRRALHEEKFPGLWTVPGGTLDTDDYDKEPANSAGVWYNILEKLATREVLEETGLTIKNIRYLISLAYKKKKGPAICISLFADYAGGEVKIDADHSDYKWVTLQEAKHVEFVEGIYEELLMVEDIIHKRPVHTWEEYEQLARKHK